MEVVLIRLKCSISTLEDYQIRDSKQFASFFYVLQTYLCYTNQEYLLETINKNIENHMMEGLQKKLPEDFKSEIRKLIKKVKKI